MIPDEEDQILKHLTAAHNLFVKLPSQHPMEQLEWALRLHALQDMIAMRVARRVEPDTFPTFAEPVK
jgi:hypothetical protein